MTMNTNELIKVDTNEKGEIIVSGRELHELLEVTTRYNDWIKNRITKYDFIENVDFICLTKVLVTQTEQGKRGESKYIDHAITLNMAKELSMVENNAKGRQARRYFIECEKQLLETKTNSVRTLTREQELALKILEGRVGAEELKEYRDIVAIKAIDGNNLILTCGQVVTQLQFNVPNLTTTILNSWLAEVLGLGEYKVFGKDKRRTFQPNEAYLKFVSGEGCAMTGKTISSGKITMYYTSSMVARIVKHHMGSLIEYTNAKMIA